MQRAAHRAQPADEHARNEATDDGASSAASIRRRWPGNEDASERSTDETNLAKV